MSDTCLQEGKALLDLLRRELRRANGLAALFRAPNTKPMVEAINRHGRGSLHNLVWDAIHKDLILTVTKLYDREPQTVSFPKAIKLLQKAPIPLPQHLAEAQQRLEATTEYRSRLRALRNSVIAHNQIDPPDHGATYGDDLKALDDASAIFSCLCAAVGEDVGTSVWEEWMDEAEHYWRPLLETAAD